MQCIKFKCIKSIKLPIDSVQTIINKCAITNAHNNKMQGNPLNFYKSILLIAHLLKAYCCWNGYKSCNWFSSVETALVQHIRSMHPVQNTTHCINAAPTKDIPKLYFQTDFPIFSHWNIHLHMTTHCAMYISWFWTGHNQFKPVVF